MELDYLDSSKKKENYTSKSFKENRDQDEPVYRPKVFDHKHVPYSSHNKHLIIGFIIIAAGCATTYFVYFRNSNNDATITTVPSATSEPGNVTCDFEESSGCDYAFGSHFVWREGYIHHLPSIDHTIGNESGHYMYFTSPSREEGILTSPYMVTTSGGCLYFYYNMEGGPSVELKIYIQAGVNKTMTFYANGIDMKTDQWKKGWFNIPPGRTELFFHAYGDIYYLKPSIVAIDDIFFDEGTSCPASPNCSDNGLFGCETSGVCIPQYLTTDGYSDCFDASDERVNTTDTSPQTNETWVSRCTFESPEDDSCLFSNDVSGIDDADWLINSGSAPSRNTGPSTAAVGTHYLYIETSDIYMDYGDFAYYISSAMNFNSSLCMSFYYHMYGTSVGSLEVIAYSSAGTQVLFSQSSDQGNRWYYQDVHIANLDNVKIIFNATDGDWYRGDIAIDHILLFLNQCEVFYHEPKVRLVGGRDRSSGRLEIKLLSDTFYRPVCTTYWDEDDTKVVCRELGYSNFRLLKLSEYGKGRIGRSTFRNQFHCSGDEEKLSDCVSTTAYSCPGEIVAIQCSNSHCFDGEISCGDTTNNGISTCIEEKNWCNGNFDCPNFADEHTCGHCNDTEFECNNHQCIPTINRCDGTPQCDDKSDEFRCVIKDDDSDQVHVYKDNRWTALCYSDDLTLAEYLCSITGFGSYLSSSKGGIISNGLTVVPSDNPHGIITNYWLQDTVTCHSLDLLCGDIECGVSTVLPRSTSAGSYILFGNDAINGEWPWQALFFRGSSSICGAVLIDPLWALTAAHCVDSGNGFSIHVGEVKESEMGSKGQRLSVAEVITHENYKGRSNSYSNDIALLRLSSKAIFNDFVRPACIGTNTHGSYDYCYITGWGYTHFENGKGIPPDNLKEVQVDMNTDVDRCNRTMLAVTNSAFHIPGNGICVDNKNPHAPACDGDSGGPLVCLNNEGRWEVLGVSSFGVRGCFTDQIPSIYQSVPHNSDWIAHHTGLNLTIPRQPTKPPA